MTAKAPDDFFQNNITGETPSGDDAPVTIDQVLDRCGFGRFQVCVALVVALQSIVHGFLLTSVPSSSASVFLAETA